MFTKTKLFGKMSGLKNRMTQKMGHTGPTHKMAFHNPIRADVVNSHGIITQTVFTQNGITDQGMDDLLDVAFRAQTQHTVWYMALIDGAGTQTLAAADVGGTHAGWTENTNHTGGARISWTGSLSAASSRSITNSSTLDYAYTTTEEIHGIFLINHLTADTASEILWSTAPFSTEVTVNNGDTLKITYTVSG